MFAQRENPGVHEALGFIAEIYKVEREARDAAIAGSLAHLELRRTRSRPLFARLLSWARKQKRHYKAEGALRRVAKGRANFLFVGSETDGHNLATIYTLVASCEQNRIDPIAYLTDVLIRVQHHPASKVRELLPHLWKLTTTRNRS